MKELSKNIFQLLWALVKIICSASVVVFGMIGIFKYIL